MPAKILFLVPYPLKESPSQRFRFEQYFKILKIRGHEYSVQTFLNSHNWQIFLKSGKIILKLSALLGGFTKRFFILLKAPGYDFVFIHREALPIGLPVFEWLLAKVLRRKIIYDFDDAIWLTDRTNESFVIRMFKWRSKVAQICRWAYKISAGNDFLCQYASAFNTNVVHNPTTIDTEYLHNPDLFPARKMDNSIIIGWTGSHSTLKYIREVESVLKKITEENPQVEFIVIADQKPDLSFSRWTFIEWNEKTEIEDLMKLDIGIMPLPDDEWAKGKCGFKALQYMALKIPAVISPVGVNTTIINHGVDGFLARTSDEWFTYLKVLINDDKLRRQMGELSRKKIIDHYSVTSNSENFLSLFE